MQNITWQQRIRDLQGDGMTLEAIGKAIGLATSSVGDLATGRSLEPMASAGMALHDLHLKRGQQKKRVKAARAAVRGS